MQSILSAVEFLSVVSSLTFLRISLAAQFGLSERNAFLPGKPVLSHARLSRPSAIMSVM